MDISTRPLRLLATAALTVAAVSCNGGEKGDAAGPTTTTGDATTSTTAGSTTTTDPARELARCSNPDNFSIGHPRDCPVPSAVATDPEGVEDLQRRALEIDGLEAARISYETGEERRTLFVDTVGLSPFDYEENVEILDRMAPTVDFTVG